MHENHRERMRERYYTGGFDSFSEHEILEMILYHSISRGDTNESAHLLIERFGGFRGVVEASIDELRSVKGIGESSAMLIKLIEASVRAYVSALARETVYYDTVSRIARFAWMRCLGLNRERVYLLLFDNRMSILDCVVLAEGTVNESTVQPRLIAEKAFEKKAANVVLAHNHPYGDATPSEDDVNLTFRLIDGLSLIGISLLEHLVITEKSFWPIVKHIRRPSDDSLSEAARVQTSRVNLDRFYDVDESSFTFSSMIEEVAGDRRLPSGQGEN